VWPAHGVLYAASTTLGMDAFGPAVPISPPGGYARDPQLVADEDGNVVAVWTDSHGDGNALLAAGKPRGGAFGRVFQIQRSTYGVTSPRATLAGNGEILVTYVSTRRRLPVAHHRGTVRLARLDPTGRHVAPLVTISPAGAPATEIVASAGEVAWASDRRIVTREIGGGGALGPVQTIAGGPATELSLAANATGRGVLTWVADGRVYASVRR
jgi:hypothetical protein